MEYTYETPADNMDNTCINDIVSNYDTKIDMDTEESSISRFTPPVELKDIDYDSLIT